MVCTRCSDVTALLWATCVYAGYVATGHAECVVSVCILVGHRNYFLRWLYVGALQVPRGGLLVMHWRSLGRWYRGIELYILCACRLVGC